MSSQKSFVPLCGPWFKRRKPFQVDRRLVSCGAAVSGTISEAATTISRTTSQVATANPISATHTAAIPALRDRSFARASPRLEARSPTGLPPRFAPPLRFLSPPRLPTPPRSPTSPRLMLPRSGQHRAARGVRGVRQLTAWKLLHRFQCDVNAWAGSRT